MLEQAHEELKEPRPDHFYLLSSQILALARLAGILTYSTLERVVLFGWQVRKILVDLLLRGAGSVQDH